MRAGRVLIRSHGKTNVDKILPALEAGLINIDWRIRQASLGLIGDLLSLIGGTTVAGLGEVGSEDDTRGAERAQANDNGVDASFVIKRRLDGERTEVTAVSAQVSGRTVVIYDDMIRTGGSLIGAAKAYHNSGAAKIFAITTHGIFPGTALTRIRDSGLFEQLVATDSHPRATKVAAQQPDFLEVVGLAEVLHTALREHP